MKNKLKKTAAFVLALTLTAGAVPAAIGGAAIVAKADNETVSDYTLTIPASFDIKNEGWNEIGDISVTGQLADGEKLVVSADSANHGCLKKEGADEEINYYIRGSAEGEETTSWEFTSLSETPAKQTIGVDVEPFKGKDLPAGKYTDVLTFTASVEDVPVTGIKLDKTTLGLFKGGSTATLKATVSPDNAADKTVTWESSNTDVATVENGVVTPVGEGTATITATAGDKTATCTVTVVSLSTAFDNGATINFGIKFDIFNSTINMRNDNGSYTYLSGQMFVNNGATMTRSGNKLILTVDTMGQANNDSNKYVITLDADDNSYTVSMGDYIQRYTKGNISISSLKINGVDVASQLVKK